MGNMTQSASIIEIAKALCSFQSGIGAIKKDATNPFFKSKYASLENIWSEIRAPLGACGLSVAQFPNGENELVSILMHISGEWMSASMKLTPKDATPQAQGSAITYARRYALSAILGLVTEEDDDGNTASTPTKQTVTPQRMAQIEAFDKGMTKVVFNAKCSFCGKLVTTQVEKVSMEKFGLVLCYPVCQNKFVVLEGGDLLPF